MLSMIDAFLDRVTMYRLVVYSLAGIFVWSLACSALGLIAPQPWEIFFSAATVVLVGWGINYVFANITGAVTNSESALITGLILALIVPVNFPNNFLFLVLAGVFSSASKFLLTVEKQHLFNPAAAVVVAAALLTDSAATWWVGVPALLPAVLVAGFLIVRRTQREGMVLTFLTVYFALVGGAAFVRTGNPAAVFQVYSIAVFSSAVFFFAVIMLTEPLTAPGKKSLRLVFAGLVGALYATPSLRLGGIGFTPEWALVLGNVFSFAVNPKYRFVLPLDRKEQLSKNALAFLFRPADMVDFFAGQYMEWTLPHEGVDSRGNRRYFSLASSPTEDDLMVVARFPDKPSSYKRTMQVMNPGQTIVAAQLSGDFVLPEGNEKLVFIAGGIGIAPFRSMIKYLVDKRVQKDVVLIYSEHNRSDFLFADLFDQAAEMGVQTVYVVTDPKAEESGWKGKIGHIDAKMITELVPDFGERKFFVSGPQLLVGAAKKTLESLGLPRAQIVTDYFPGYAGAN